MLNNNSIITALQNKIIYSLFISLFFILSCSDSNTNAVVENANIEVHGIQIKGLNQNIILRYFNNKYDSKYSDEIKVHKNQTQPILEIELLDKNGNVMTTIPKNNFRLEIKSNDANKFKINRLKDYILRFQLNNFSYGNATFNISISCNYIQNIKIDKIKVIFVDYDIETLTKVDYFELYNSTWGNAYYFSLSGGRLNFDLDKDSTRYIGFSIRINGRTLEQNKHKIEIKNYDKNYIKVTTYQLGFGIEALKYGYSDFDFLIYELYKGQYVEILNHNVPLRID